MSTPPSLIIISSWEEEFSSRVILICWQYQNYFEHKQCHAFYIIPIGGAQRGGRKVWSTHTHIYGKTHKQDSKVKCANKGMYKMEVSVEENDSESLINPYERKEVDRAKVRNFFLPYLF